MIHPYESRLRNAVKCFNESNISEVNKRYVRDFLVTYNVEKSTLAKFYTLMKIVLSETPDIKVTMNDDKELPLLFEKLHKKYSASSYLSMCESTKRLCKWLNGNGRDDLPKAFDNIMKLTKKEKTTLRRASREDYETLEWEEGEKLISVTSDLQDKAFIMVELDGGFRPQELLNLDYGDVKRDKDGFFILHVGESKTAEERDVVIYRASSYLNQWMDAHPTKAKHDPLFILKRSSGVERYTQNAAKKLLFTLTKRAGIKKSVNMYMLRHSAVRLKKLENISVDMASMQFGHSPTFFVSTYGKLSQKDKLDKFKKHYKVGTEAEQEEDNKPKVCPVCNEINQHVRTHCIKCNSALTLTVALEEKQDKDARIKQLEEQMEKQNQNISLLLSMFVGTPGKKGPEELAEISAAINAEVKRRGLSK